MTDQLWHEANILLPLVKGAYHEASRGPFRASINRVGVVGEGWSNTHARMLINLRFTKAEADVRGGVVSISYDREHAYVGGREVSVQFYLGHGHWTGLRFGW